jgi:hypothetical protein
MHGVILITGFFMFLYSWMLGCQIVADREFRIYEGKRTGRRLFVAWTILFMIGAVTSGQ